MTEEKRRSGWFWVCVGGGLFIAFIAVVSVVAYFAVQSIGGNTSFGGDNIGVIDIDGVILSADKTVDNLRKFDQDDSIKAIILHIDSPGGGAAASQEIYKEVRHIRDEKKKPIIASVESVGASGAYYIASGANKIYANDASIVGSIGVIMEWTNYGDLLKWAKLKPEVLKAGSLKDAGSPTREMTPEERAYFQGLVDNMHSQFIRDVAAGRGISVDTLTPLATGQVWTGQQALPLHLIDKQGGFRDALLDTAKQVGISGEPNVVKPARKGRSILDLVTTDADDLLPNPQQLLEKHAGFYFLWR
ncbi:signal peptide peptidase SppA [Alloacidobacterium sp.]|uniref:signal peptide peptidase SppA n=1 Tax=Alloacidobacterium sp. TaxID=2951999 RepID=UPI002D582EAA|nr:signal peptide peptidase SppA [Alloacidobacterium sp.]HYK37010.1 signal peptide peptidase SppA [Alloacidobacterium sp.]